MTSGSRAITEPVAAFAAIARALTESLDLTEVLPRIAIEARAMTDAKGASILLWQRGFAEFAAHSSAPPGSRIPVGFRFQPNAEVIQKLRGRTKPLVIRDLHESPLIPNTVKDQIYVNDLVIVPLRADDVLIGVLNLAFDQMPEPVTWNPMILGALADQAALAVRNAQLYEACRSVNEKLIQAEKISALGRLVAQVTHELNNPLTTARLLAESLELEPLSETATDLVHSLGSELEHAATIVRDLLLHVHQPTAKVDLEVSDLFQSIISQLERRARAAGVSIELDLVEPIPTLYADPDALRQVISNLVQNGIYALSRLGSDRRIRVGVRGEKGRTGQKLIIEVEDTGPGIADEIRGRIFEPFFTTKPIGEGTGLGLTIIRGIIEAHNGTIRALSSPTGGALFRIVLPAIPSPPSITERGTITPKEDLSVLIIDDEPELQRALSRVLEHLGCQVTSAPHGQRGLELIRKYDFDLILCDLRLPGLHGNDLLEEIREARPEAANTIVFMTGDTISREIHEFIRESGRPSLNKPFGRAELEEILATISTRSSSEAKGEDDG